MTVVDAPPVDLNRVLDDLVRRVPEARYAIMLSADGLLMAGSAELDRDTGENLSAVVAGLQALADAAGRQSDAGRVRQTIVEMETALLFVTASRRGGVLAVLLQGAADTASVAYEMALVASGVDGWAVVPPAASAPRGGAPAPRGGGRHAAPDDGSAADPGAAFPGGGRPADSGGGWSGGG
ncbi:roadblock/LC7 domain-containing protein, partial [Rhizomonospora bruguierae]|uniref:roadblock/LC7 domain-containing protein n=1 Tax=Rhizomonospora bruguierae TaxID=1581705 RepID=UPI001BCEEB3D